MKLLVFGRSGQVAQALSRRLPDARFLSREDVDLADADACARAVLDTPADALINAAGYTAVDRAESEERLAYRVNALAPAVMAKAAAQRRIPFIHISTDYVFAGSGERPCRPSDPVAPLNAYGRTKAAGEQAIREAGGVHAIIRTSWVFSATGRNFLKTMLTVAESRGEIAVVEDQIGGPTPSAAVAEALCTVAAALASDGKRSGTYHLAGQPEVSWADFARAIFKAAGARLAVRDIATAAYPAAAQRPLNSRLDCTTLLETFSIHRPDWRPAIHHVLAEMRRDAEAASD